ncbi:MAG: glycolate oxidase subunit GlcF [Gammaproteobacteria bacterium]
MQTRFDPERLRDPDIQEADGILRACVHCGFCTATCPTYRLRGDELDGPRGRIYLIKNMLEADAAPAPQVVTHLDRCLSCLGCMTTCPSGVNYMHLVDIARAHVERRHRRPPRQRALRALIAFVLPRPGLFGAIVAAGRRLRPLARWLPARLAGAFELLPVARADAAKAVADADPAGDGVRRVALLAGCVQPVLDSGIGAATARVLRRHGIGVEMLPAGCCGAVEHHLGREQAARARMAANVDAWSARMAATGCDALAVDASGCGTLVKDYGHLLRADPVRSGPAAALAGSVRDIAEILETLPLRRTRVAGEGPVAVAYHAPCSLQHGQRVTSAPLAVLARLGFAVRPVEDAHLCCGAAGTYHLLQPEISAELGRGKAGRLCDSGAEVIATSNLGCALQLRRFADRPVVHLVELVDWATGGPLPAALVPPRPGH